MFERALKTTTVELREELVWERKDIFLLELGYEIRKELSQAGDVVWNIERFIERVNQEIESRKIDITKFRNERGEPVTNMFKRVIRELAKESGISLSNDSLSRLLNFIRNQYSFSGKLTAGLFPVSAFFKRSKYGIPENLGDENSCFRVGGCNEGSALWLSIEDEKYDRAKLIVFHFKSGNKEGVGRCWGYKVSDGAIYATNFYSYGFDIKSQFLRYPLVRVIRSLFGMSENVRFAYNRNIYLPIYLNGDGLIIYEKDQHSNSEEIVELSKEIKSECMYCGKEYKVAELGKYDERVYYAPVEVGVKGLIVCKWCAYDLDDKVECAGCGVWLNRDKMIYHADRYWCVDCFYERFVPCDICGEYFEQEDMIVDRYEKWLCPACAKERRRLCDECREYDYPEEVHVYKVLTYSGIEERYVCNECKRNLRELKCEKCGYEFFYRESDYIEDEEIREIVKAGLCPECYRSKRLSELCECSKENLTSEPLMQILSMPTVIVRD